MSETIDLSGIARFVANQEELSQIVKRLGFSGAGEIDRFLLESYAKAVAATPVPDRLKGHIFILEPAVVGDQIADPRQLLDVLREVKANEQKSVLSLNLDLASPHKERVKLTKADLANKVGGAWLARHAQELSYSIDRCVAFGNGVSISVFVSGKLYTEYADVIEGFDKGPEDDFQHLSWQNGEILYLFAEHDLNDRSAVGIWRLPDKFVLKPNPETLIETRLYNFLHAKMLGVLRIDREAHVENEGRLDLSIQFVNGFTFILEIKWMGSCLKKAFENKTDPEVGDALKNGNNWFTSFDESVIPTGLSQVVIYYATGRFRKAYLAVFDCQRPGESKTDKSIPIVSTKGHAPENFAIMRAAVDPRYASVKSKSKS